MSGITIGVTTYALLVPTRLASALSRNESYFRDQKQIMSRPSLQSGMRAWERLRESEGGNVLSPVFPVVPPRVFEL
eukprot:1315139-Amorphochlora_amoeboformis.AAC.3